MIVRVLRLWVLRVGLVAAIVAVGGCSVADDGGRDHNPAHRPGYEPSEADGVGQASPGEAGHEVRGGSGYSATPSVFQLVDGADIVRVSLGDLGGDLFSVATPADSKVAPSVAVDGNTVLAGLRGSGLSGPAMVTVVLARDVRWQIRLAGGASEQAVDLSGGPGGDVELSAGTSRAEIVLPAASGTQRVTMSGGAGRMVVHLGGAAPVRVTARQGAAVVTVDGVSHSGVAGGTVFSAPGWDVAQDRFDIDAAAGVSDLTVTRG
ncbi:hypothetical protein [Actinoplanes sp. NPDC051494]|uniref:hypothetical protein n=1 Tax=Actinoplanes sp. NPDC051494 TaxID=3363907 RepID=UPI0037B7344C